MNPMFKRLFEIQPYDTLRKAVYVADEMRDYSEICCVCRLEEKGFSFRFMRNPEIHLDIDIYAEDETVVLKLRNGSVWATTLYVEQAVTWAKEIIQSWEKWNHIQREKHLIFS